MKRTGFARPPAYAPRSGKQWTADTLPGPRTPPPPAPPSLAPVVSLPKDDPDRDEAYRRLIAALPCSNCGIEGYSQAAHGPTLGAGIKSDDSACFPLCCDRPLVKGCHARYDQYELFDQPGRVRMAEVWAEDARLQLEGLPA